MERTGTKLDLPDEDCEAVLRMAGKDGILKQAISAIEDRAAKFQEKGMTQANFAIGVANVLFLAWSFGALRGYLWIIYIAEVCAFLPFRYQAFAKAKPSEVYYLTEFCWVANVGAVLGLIFLAFSPSSTFAAQKWFFSAAWGVSNGPLLGAAGLLGNSLLFHDFALAISAMIHVLPCLVMFEMRWDCAAVQAAWPQLQMCDVFADLHWYDTLLTTGCVWGVWALAFTVWMLIWGMKLPQSGYDTMFHASMRISGGAMAAKATGFSEEELEAQRKTDNYPRSYVLVHMFNHMLLNSAAALLALICTIGPPVHAVICFGMLWMITYNGAKRYTYLLMDSYQDAVKGLQEPLLDKESPESNEPSEPVDSNAGEDLTRVLVDAVAEQAKKFERKGLTRGSFVLSVLNTLFLAWAFGALPAYFWVVYLVQGFALLPLRLWRMAHATPNEFFYLLDLGWISIIGLLCWLSSLSYLGLAAQKTLFCTAWAISNGPLLLSPALLRSSMMFHNLDQMLSVWIQLLPSLVMFHMAWSRDSVELAWPHIQTTDFFADIDPLQDIFLNACIYYAIWAFAFFFWLLTCGMRLARSGYDTSWHYALRGPRGEVVARALGKEDEHIIYTETNDFPLSYMVVFLVYHALVCLMTFAVSVLCFVSPQFHAVGIISMVVMTILNASGRYTYYFVRSYLDAVSSKMNVALKKGMSSVVLGA